MFTRSFRKLISHGLAVVMLGGGSMTFAQDATPETPSQSVASAAVQDVDGSGPLPSDDWAALSAELKREIEAAWKSRARRLRSIELEYKTTSLEYPEPWAPDESTQPQPDASQAIDAPPIEWSTSYRLKVEGRRMYFATARNHRNPDGRVIAKPVSVSTYNGADSRKLAHPRGPTSYPSGYITSHDYSRGAVTLVSTYPIRLLTSPLDSTLSHIDLSSPNVTCYKTEIDGRPLIVLEKLVVSNPVSHSDRYFIDPAQDYTVVRYLNESIYAGVRRLKRRSDITYTQREDGVWCPTEWVLLSYRNDHTTVERSDTTKVTDLTLNPVFDESAFEIEFPVGTVVQDVRPQHNDQPLGTHGYIVMEDGGKRTITWDERSATYEELLASPSGMAGKIPKRNEPLIIINIFVVIVLAGLIVRKRYRARASL